MSMQVAKNVSKATISAVVRRADGSVEDLGIVTSYVRPVWRTWLLRVKGYIHGKFGN